MNEKTQKQQRYIHFIAVKTGGKYHSTYDGKQKEYQLTYIDETRGLHITTRDKSIDYSYSKVFKKLYEHFGDLKDEKELSEPEDLSQDKSEREEGTTGGFYNGKEK
jgi:hypothetical protein